MIRCSWHRSQNTRIWERTTLEWETLKDHAFGLGLQFRKPTAKIPRPEFTSSAWHVVLSHHRADLHDPTCLFAGLKDRWDLHRATQSFLYCYCLKLGRGFLRICDRVRTQVQTSTQEVFGGAQTTKNWKRDVWNLERPRACNTLEIRQIKSETACSQKWLQGSLQEVWSDSRQSCVMTFICQSKGSKRGSLCAWRQRPDSASFWKTCVWSLCRCLFHHPFKSLHKKLGALEMADAVVNSGYSGSGTQLCVFGAATTASLLDCQGTDGHCRTFIYFSNVSLLFVRIWRCHSLPKISFSTNDVSNVWLFARPIAEQWPRRTVASQSWIWKGPSFKSCKVASCDAIFVGNTSQVLEPASESEIHWRTRSKRNFERQVLHYNIAVFTVSGHNMQ